MTEKALELGTEAYVYGYPLVTMEMTGSVMTNWQDGGKAVEQPRRVEVSGGARVRTDFLTLLPGGKDEISEKEIAEEAYIYAFPMVMNYGTMYEYFIDTKSDQYKAPFNQIYNTGRVFTPKDTAIVAPNSDTPYSILGMDLRAEPVVLCVPEVEKGHYYSVQLIDLYTFNYGYIGSRATGNGAGCYLVAGPNWKGETPKASRRCFAARRNSLWRPTAPSSSTQPTSTT